MTQVQLINCKDSKPWNLKLMVLRQYGKCAMDYLSKGSSYLQTSWKVCPDGNDANLITEFFNKEIVLPDLLKLSHNLLKELLKMYLARGYCLRLQHRILYNFLTSNNLWYFYQSTCKLLHFQGF